MVADSHAPASTLEPGRSQPARKWRVAIIVALFVGPVWYLMTPGVDPRFVGRWQLQSPLQTPGWVDLLEFRFDGTCEKSGRSSPGEPMSTIGLWDWQVVDDVLVLHQRRTPDPTVPAFVNLVQSATDLWSNRDEEPTRLRFVQVEADRIALMTIPVLTGYEPTEVILIRVEETAD